ncbi:MAG: HAMP domain-containing protein [Parcubacteria group bacterium]|nr:HAMP domain-containing protein [Parcubacteria group bacterium]
MLWRPKIKIKTKILGGFLLLLAVSVSVVSAVAFWQFRNILRDQVLSDFVLTAETKEGYVMAFLDNLKGRVADFSSDGLIRDLTAEISAGKDGQARDLLNRHLIQQKMPLDEFLLGINVIDLNGRVIASTREEEIGRDESADDYFIKAKELSYGEAYIPDIPASYHFEGRGTLAISASLIDKTTGRPIGVIANFIDVKNVGDLMTGERQIRLGATSGVMERMKTFETYLTSAEGLVLTELKFMPDAVLKRKLDALPVKKCREEKKEIAALYGNYLDIPVIGASMCLPNGWTLIVEMSEDEALGRVGDIQQYVVFLILAAMAAGSAAAYWLAWGIAKPITRLAQTAEEIKAGNFSKKADVASTDEIGQLAVSFNEMIDKINKRAEEAEKLSDAMVGRELRMMELKKELEELKKKAGTTGDNTKEK